MEYNPNERDYTLGLLIDQPGLLEAVEIPPDFFHTDRQRAIWGAVCELKAAGIPIGDLTVAEKVLGNGNVGYLTAITSGLIPFKPEDFRRHVYKQAAEDFRGRIISQVEREAKSGLFDYDSIVGMVEQARRLELEAEALTGERAGPRFRRLDEVEGREISWLWAGRIPLGMISLCAGDPGLGKSFLATWLASRLSVGGALPGDPGPALSGSTIYLSAEDSPAYALRPRAERNGADLSRIVILEGSAFDISADLEGIRAIAKKILDVRLLIIDPLNSYLGKTDYLKDPDVRTILNPVVEFCEVSGIACLCVMHLNKKTDQAGIYRIGGSIAFAGVARSILAVTADPEEPDRRLLRPIKMNYARKPPSLAFRISEDLFLSFDEGTVEIDANEPLTPPSGREAADGTYASAWLAEHLSAGPLSLRDILKSASENGISHRAIYRAKDKLKLRSRCSGFGKGRDTTWELPE